MLNWFKRDAGGGQTRQRKLRAFSEEGLLVVSEQTVMDPSIAKTAKVVESPELEALLHQLEDEGFAVPLETGHLLPWDSLYDLLEHPAYRTSLTVFEIPKIAPDAPILESRDS